MLGDVMSEEILGIFPGWIDISGRFLAKSKTCKLVFTTNRLVVKMEKERIGRPTFVFGPDYISSRASVADRLKMKETSSESILKSNAENIEIPYSDITHVEIKSFFGQASRELRVFMDDLNVPRHKFMIAMRSPHIDDFVELLKTILPDKI